MSRNEWNRSAWLRTLYALEHHAKPLLELALRLWSFAAVNGWRPTSIRGGPNSWELMRDGQWIRVRGRLKPEPRIEITRAGRMVELKTRNQVDRWAERNLV